MAKKIENKKGCTVKNTLGYVIGSVALCAAGFLAIPKALLYISGKINRSMVKKSNAKKADDDWGPVIERKSPEEHNEGDQ